MPIPIAIAAGVILRQVAMFAAREIARTVFIESAIDIVTNRKDKLDQEPDEAIDDLLELGASSAINEFVSGLTALLISLSFIESAASLDDKTKKSSFRTVISDLVALHRGGHTAPLESLLMTILDRADKEGIVLAISSNRLAIPHLNALAHNAGAALILVVPSLYMPVSATAIAYEQIPVRDLAEKDAIVNPLMAFVCTPLSEGSFAMSANAKYITDLYTTLACAHIEEAYSFMLYIDKIKEYMVSAAADATLLSELSSLVVSTTSHTASFGQLAAFFSGAVSSHRVHGYLAYGTGFMLSATALPISDPAKPELADFQHPLARPITRTQSNEYEKNLATRDDSDSPGLMDTIGILGRLKRGASTLKRISTVVKRLKT